MQKIRIIFLILFFSFDLVVLGKAETPVSKNVKIFTVHARNYQKKIISTGSLIAIPGIVVKPEISGRITKIYFKSGEKVSAGTPLVGINPDILKPQVMQMEAELSLEKLQFSRKMKLYQKHFISRSELDTAKTNLITDQEKVGQYKAELKQMTVVAPFSGTLGLSMVNLGDYITAGQGIVTLNQLSPLYIDFSVPEIYINEINKGQTVLIQSDIYFHQIFKGTIIALESEIDKSNRSLMVRAEILNNDEKLLPGTFSQVTILLGLPKKVVAVPQTAIIYSSKGNYVYKVQNGKAVKNAIIIGENDADDVIVNSGLEMNDKIIASGNLKVKN